MKASELFRKCPKTFDLDNSNYRLFERIPAVPDTSNNQGLTVVGFSIRFEWKPLQLFVLHINESQNRRMVYFIWFCQNIFGKQKRLLYNSYTMGWSPVRGDNPRALASGLSYVQVDKHGITILYHQHQCRPSISQDISC